MSAVPLPPLAQAISAGFGGVVSNVLIYPLDVVVARTQTSARSSKGTKGYTSLLASIRTLYSQEGLTSFYAGLLPDSISTALSNFLYFYTYSFLRNTLLGRKRRGAGNGKKATQYLTAVEEILIGIVSGCVAKGITSPLANIAVRAQTSTHQTVESKPSPPSSKLPVAIADLKSTKALGLGSVKEDVKLMPSAVNSLEEEDSSDDEGHSFSRGPSSLEIAREIYKEKGWTGFWSGYKNSIVLTTNPAITQYLFEIFKRAVIPVQHRAHPTPAQVFLTSAFASSVASAITYPLILSKTRLQFKSPSGRQLYKSAPDVLLKTYRRQGVRGLYSGLEGQIVKVFLSEGIKMTVKQRLELLIVLAHGILTKRQLEGSAVRSQV